MKAFSCLIAFVFTVNGTVRSKKLTIKLGTKMLRALRNQTKSIFFLRTSCKLGLSGKEYLNLFISFITFSTVT
jgi:hypothetical protein